MKYSHLSMEERYRIGALRIVGKSQRAIARELGRSASTISRELCRNRSPFDGHYRALHAGEQYRGRRRRSRLGVKISDGVWKEVEKWLREDFSPEQVSGYLKRMGKMSISHESIYKYVWRDKEMGGDLWTHLRGSRKQRRKRYRSYDSRGRLAGKRMIGDRPKVVERRKQLDHWEIDTVMSSGRECILTMVERKSGFTQIGVLEDRTVLATNRRMLKLMGKELNRYRTITADNGCEFHGYKTIEDKTSVPFYFATPHHSWERGTNENTNGLIRQYLPKGTSMKGLTQARCNAIADKLNSRPRKRHNYKTPIEVFYNLT